MNMPVVTLLGDLIDSRLSADRQQLHDTLTEVLAAVSKEWPAQHDPAITAGDEFQGTYTRLGDALGSVLAIRSLLEPSVGMRFGVGRGEVTMLDAENRTQDGPGWWAARAAIDAVEAGEEETGWTALRTAYRNDDDEDPWQDAVNAALVCQDLLLDSFDQRSWSILRGMMAGKTQTQIAEDLGISRQAVQQRRSSAGMPMLLSAAHSLARLP